MEWRLESSESKKYWFVEEYHEDGTLKRVIFTGDEPTARLIAAAPKMQDALEKVWHDLNALPVVGISQIAARETEAALRKSGVIE